MRKVILLSIFFVGIAMPGGLAMLWHICGAWNNTEIYSIHDEPAIISRIKKNIFHADCPCLTFAGGYLYHGQDTFEVMKFNIDQTLPSWDVILNRLGIASGGCIEVKSSDEAGNHSLPLILRNLSVDNERMVCESLLEQISVFVTYNNELSLLYLYLVGNIIPLEQINLIIHESQ